MREEFAQYIETNAVCSGLHLKTALKNAWFDLAEIIITKIYSTRLGCSLSECLNESIKCNRQDCEDWLLAHDANHNVDTPYCYIQYGKVRKVLTPDIKFWVLDKYINYAINNHLHEACLILLNHFVTHVRCKSPKEHTTDYALSYGIPVGVVHKYFLYHDDLMDLLKYGNQDIHTFIFEHDLCDIDNLLKNKKYHHAQMLNNCIYWSDTILPYIKPSHIISQYTSVKFTKDPQQFLKVCNTYTFHFEIGLKYCIERGHTEFIEWLMDYHGIHNEQQMPQEIAVGKSKIKIINKIEIDYIGKIIITEIEKVIHFLERRIGWNLDYSNICRHCLMNIRYTSSFISYLLTKISSESRNDLFEDHIADILKHPLSLDIIRVYFGQMTEYMFTCFFQLNDIAGMVSTVNMCRMHKLPIKFDWLSLQYIQTEEMAYELYNNVLCQSIGDPPLLSIRLFFDKPTVFLFFVSKGYWYDLMDICKELEKCSSLKTLCTLERELFRYIDLTNYPRTLSCIELYDKMKELVDTSLEGKLTKQIIDHILLKYM